MEEIVRTPALLWPAWRRCFELQPGFQPAWSAGILTTAARVEDLRLLPPLSSFRDLGGSDFGVRKLAILIGIQALERLENVADVSRLDGIERAIVIPIEAREDLRRRRSARPFVLLCFGGGFGTHGSEQGCGQQKGEERGTLGGHALQRTLAASRDKRLFPAERVA
jgi:hypothetical protein